MRDAVIPSFLPTPNEEEIHGFMELYRTKYGKELDKVDAQRMLSGLMRFCYLARTRPPEEEEPTKTEASTEPVPLHPTQLTARKGGKSRKKQ
ncbi:MAG: hypothetical protein ACRYFS_19755 [Janthinobacterium lividum]